MEDREPHRCARTAGRKGVVVGLLVLMAATLGAYLPAFRAGFVWDDDQWLTRNQVLLGPDALRRIWLEPAAQTQYYPLTYTTFWIEHQLWGLRPAGYHIVNVILHIGNAILVWLVLRAFQLRGAWLAAAIFALHPVNVESVAWISERKNTLSALFYLASILAFVHARGLTATWSPRRWRAEALYAATLLAAGAAMLSKTATCTIPAALGLLLWWQRGRLPWRELLRLLPFFAAAVGLGVLTYVLEARHVQSAEAAFDFSWVDRTLIAGRALWFYAGKLLWPIHVAFVYPRWDINAHVWWQYLYPAAALLLVLVLVVARRRIGTSPLVAVLFYGGTLLPVLGFINFYYMRYAFVADHFQYLPGLGLITLVAATTSAALRRLGPRARRAGPVVGAALLALLGTGAHRQSSVYETRETLWRDALAKNPDAFLAYVNLGMTTFAEQRDADAVRYFEAALAVRPDAVRCRKWLARAYARQRQFAAAAANYERAVQDDPADSQLAQELGAIYVELGRDDDALRYLLEALRLSPQCELAAALVPISLTRRVGELLMQNALPEAVSLTTRALQYLPDVLSVRVLHARALAAAGQSAAAAAEYRNVLQRDPDQPEVLRALAWLLATDADAQVRNGAEAVALAERACRLTAQQDIAALDTLAAALAEAGQYDRAIEVATRARDLAARRGPASMVPDLDARLELLRANRPYHTPPAGAPAREGEAASGRGNSR
jgi:tetratricopeptide (TPR) repeat protein